MVLWTLSFITHSSTLHQHLHLILPCLLFSSSKHHYRQFHKNRFTAIVLLFLEDVVLAWLLSISPMCSVSQWQIYWEFHVQPYWERNCRSNLLCHVQCADAEPNRLSLALEHMSSRVSSGALILNLFETCENTCNTHRLPSQHIVSRLAPLCRLASTHCVCTGTACSNLNCVFVFLPTPKQRPQ